MKIQAGTKFGMLTFERHVRNDYTSGGQPRPVGVFRCECGGEKETRIYSVSSGRVKSCGCERGAASVTHGAARNGELAPEYRAWRCMLTRAKNHRISHAHNYSGRGIGVAAEWDSGGDGEGYQRFLADVGLKPSPEMSLDRIDVNKGYQPGNVRWATSTQQARNRTDNRIIEYQGEAASLGEWADRYGMPWGRLRDRIDKLGWPIEKALTQQRRGSR